MVYIERITDAYNQQRKVVLMMESNWKQTVSRVTLSRTVPASFCMVLSSALIISAESTV